ncbi:MAG: GyrI-like domain-containing protein [Steroidobacteraceae bacterium]
MQKIDVRKTLAPLYETRTEAVTVDVPPLRYLMIDGHGDPNSSATYAEAVEALFSVSYAIKFAAKRAPEGHDYGVLPLEGLWWSDDHTAFVTGDKSRWSWTMMILQPDFVSEEIIRQSMASVAESKGLAAIERLRLETFSEGRCAQILHVGPFSDEGPTIERLHAFIETRGELAGKHHEIYLSDIRRALPARWKTLIRQPMR